MNQPPNFSSVAIRRFAARCALGLGGVFGLGVTLTLLLVPIAGATTAGGLEPASGPLSVVFGLVGFVNETAATVGWLILPAAVVFLLLRRLLHLALYVAVAGTGILMVDFGLVTLGRLVNPRPGMSVAPAEGLPHLSGSFLPVMCAVLVLVFLPVVRSGWRRWTIAAVVALIVLTGVADIAVRESSILEVLGAWILAMAWIALASRAFRLWRAEQGVPLRDLREGICPEARPDLLPAPAHDSDAALGLRGAAALIVTATLLVALLTAAGALITEVLAPVRRFDSAVVEWFAGNRTDALSVLAATVDHVGNTPGIIAVLIVGAPLTLAITKRRNPPLFLLTATVGETAIFLTSQAFVDRMRPAVEHIAAEPATSSFPSGHVAASIVTYGGIALLLVAWNRSELRYFAFVLAGLIAVGVTLARLYAGMHYPTDILASALFAMLWLGACWRVFRPGRVTQGTADSVRRPVPAAPAATRRSRPRG